MKHYMYFLLISFCASSHFAFANQCVGYEPAKVELSGIVLSEQRYGPPNYGENPKIDAKIVILILRLDSPLKVEAQSRTGPDRDSFFNVENIQLISPSNLINLNFVGRRVTLFGSLFERENGNQYTNVLMFVDSIVSKNSQKKIRYQ